MQLGDLDVGYEAVVRRGACLVPLNSTSSSIAPGYAR